MASALSTLDEERESWLLDVRSVVMIAFWILRDESTELEELLRSRELA